MIHSLQCLTFYDFLTVCKVYHHSRLLSFSLSFELLGSLDFMPELGVHWLLFGFGRAFDKLKFIKHSTRSWTVSSQMASFFIVDTVVCNTRCFWYSLLAVDLEWPAVNAIWLATDYDGCKNTIFGDSFQLSPKNARLINFQKVSNIKSTKAYGKLAYVGKTITAATKYRYWMQVSSGAC